MKKVLVFGASSSKESINKKLAEYTASKIEGTELRLLDLNNFEMPIYSIDRENADGIPEKAHAFIGEIEGADAIIVSLAEHNGSYSSAFKNVLDWASRASKKLWANKTMFLLATSPGGRGGATVHGLAKTYFPHMGAHIVADFILPSFYDNFSDEEGIRNPKIKVEFNESLVKFTDEISKL